MHKSGVEALSPAVDDIRPIPESAAAKIHVGMAERTLSVVGGGALLAYGLRRQKWSLMLGGTALLYRGAGGFFPMYWPLNGQTKGWQIEESITIYKPVEEVYSRWRRIEELPRFMSHLESVTQGSAGRSHWVAKIPLRVEWDAEMTEAEEPRRISWRSLPGARVEHSGAVVFHPVPGRNGTEVKIIISYRPPGGSLGAAAASWLGGLNAGQIREDLKAFKAMIEAGEKPTNAWQRRRP
jgi:uncharacterized membrane protein